MSNPNDYTVGWICAISVENVAAQAFLDEKHEGPEYVSPNDNNNYTLGRIGKHNVVIAVLPDGEYGAATAATVARDMLHSFPNIRIGLMVGIGGGVPSSKHDIRLGDIVVSSPCNGESGVFQYDFGKTIQDQSFQPTGFLNQPPMLLRGAVSGLRSQYEIDGHQLEKAINGIFEKKPRLLQKYKRPEAITDKLYQAKVIHPLSLPGISGCMKVCDNDLSNIILRPTRTEHEDNPAIHYGLIASGDKLMKDAIIRDKLAVEKDVICFEMEAAGLVNHFPCLIIRGICDYSDSHKNDEWRGYAAMAAAAYAKDLLGRIRPNKVEAEKRINDILSNVQENIRNVSRGVDRLVREQHDQEYNTILNWLSPANYGSQQSDFIGRQQEGTGEWFLDSEKFQTWLCTKKQTLFCPGIKGAGKTILTSIVVEYLFTQFQKDPDVGIAYIYCDFRRQHEQSPDELLANLLKQLIQEQSIMPNKLRLLYGQHKRKGTRPSTTDILNTLISVISSFSKVFIIIDALDECQVSQGYRSIFLTDIAYLQVECNANIFVTSRFIPEITEKFKGGISLEIRATKEDVRTYLDGSMFRLPAFVRKNLELQEKIKTEIAKAADGMFLLAHLQFESLVGKSSPKSIRVALEKFSTKPDEGDKVYDKAYDEAMERIKGQVIHAQKLAEQVLFWITLAKKPLSASELRQAIAVEVDKPELDEENCPEIEDMVSVCAGLVTVDDKSNVIRLIHYTTQEYFERTQNHWFPNAETQIAKACITYLSFNIFNGNTFTFQTEMDEKEIFGLCSKYPFLSYAAQNWGYHASRSRESDIIDLILDFLEKAPKLVYFLMHTSIYQYGASGHRTVASAPKLQIAASFGLKETVKALQKRGSDIEARSIDGWTALISAAWNGQEAVIELLLGWGANIEAKNLAGWTALAIACRNRHLGVVCKLLEKGADIETKTNTGWTPLLGAAWHGHVSVVYLLLEKGADIKTKNERGWTPLHQAAGRGDNIMINILLEMGADVNARSSWGWTPLMCAARATTSTDHTINLLLRAGSDIAARDTRGETAWDKARQHGNTTIMRLLR